jgi:tRNA-2-methylthio-N6-dimethylallyladenosine synthase
MRFHIVTFGCQMNVNDSAWLARALRSRGLEEAPAGEAKVYILNTCSVREKPEQKVYSELGRLQRYWERDPSVFAAVGGCVAQQVGAGFWERFPFVRLVFGADGIAMAPQAVERLCREPELRISLLDFREEPVERDAHLDWAQIPAQAYVTIMQGCDNFCAYCIVPYVRGRQKSRASAAVLAECRGLVERGARELTLLGQNVNSYGLDKSGDGVGFAELLRAVAAIPGLERLRFTTSHPKDISDEVIAAFGELETLCPSLHLPLQAGSDAVLAAMGRGYDLARYRDIVRRLRQARPDLSLSTDLIVGFPGETEADFQATLDAVREIGFASSFSFMYSDRPGVRAERMTPKIALELKAERLSRLQALQDELTQAAYREAVGRRLPVLLEGLSKKQRAADDSTARENGLSWRGRDGHGRVVNVVTPTITPNARGLTGKLVTAEILEAKKHSLFGKVIGEPW